MSTADSPPRAVDAVRRVVTEHPVATGFALFALACAARLSLILTSRFTGDERLHWTFARGIASGTDFPLLGPSISGGGARNPGPLIYYILAIPLLISKAPEAGNAFVAILGAAAVVIYWHSLRTYFGEIGALFAGVMMACAPWSTLYADRMWNPNVIGFFVATAFWAACSLRKKPTLRAVVVLFVSMSAMPQLHLSSPMVWLALIPIWLPSLRKWRWYWPVIATVAAVLLYIPMLKSELHSHWGNVKAFLEDSSTNTSTDYQRVPLWAFRLFTVDISYHQLHSYWGPHTEKQMLDFLLNGNADFHWNVLRRFFLLLSIMFALVALAIAAIGAWGKEGRREPHPFFWAAVIGVAANTALLWVTHKDVNGHYVQCLIPFYFVVFAYLGRWAETRPRAAYFVFATALLVCIGGIDAANWVSRTMDARNGLVTIRQVIRAIEADSPNATHIGMSFDFHSSTYSYEELAAIAPGPRVHFGKGDQYVLKLADDPPPKGGRKRLRTGPIVLYRAR